MITSLLDFLKDSNLQQIFLVMGFIFTFVGISGSTWKKEQLGCFPRFVFSILGLSMLIGSGMGYFEKKENYFSEEKWKRDQLPPPAVVPQVSTSGNKIVHKPGRDDKSSTIIGDNGTIINRNNSDDIITFEGSRVYMRNNNNKIEYYITNEVGDTIIIDEALLASKGVRVQKNEPEFDENEFYEKVEDWLEGSWSIKSQYNFNFNGVVTFSKDYTFISCSSGSSFGCLDGKWQLKTEGTGSKKRYVLYLHHGQNSGYHEHNNEVVIVSFSSSNLWKSKINGTLIGEDSNYSTILKKQ